MQEVNQKPTRAIVAAVQLPGTSDVEFEASLTELRQLAKTLGFEVVGTFTQKRASFDSAGYLGLGKRKELHEQVLLGRTDLVLVDHEISPSQSHTLEKDVGCEVMDRTMVILEIFHRHARSRAARAQVEIARLGYMAPRLREAAKLAGPKDRARSGTGGRSGGESQASSTGARSATASPSCKRSSTRWSSSARRSAPGGRSARGSRAWRSSATPTRASPP